MSSPEATAAFVYLSGGLNIGQAYRLKRRGYVLVTKHVGFPMRYYGKLLKPAVAWKNFNRNKRAFYVGDTPLYAYGGLFRIHEADIVF